MTRLILLALACLFLASPAQARQRHHVQAYAVDPMCNITMPCEGVSAHPRGERVVKAMGGFGAPVQRYVPPARQIRQARVKRERPVREVSNYGAPTPTVSGTIQHAAQIVEHPAGCPRVAFCGCGAAVKLLGAPIRSLWLAANWYGFPRAAPAPGNAGVRPHHVIALIEQRRGSIWLVYDANSGGHATRIHEVDISRYTIVSPRA